MSGASHARRQLFLGRLYSSFLGIARYTSIYHSIDIFSKKIDGLLIKYQDLKSDTQGTLNQLSNYIGIPIIDNNSLENIPRNTSFAKSKIAKPSFLHPIIKAVLCNNQTVSRLISKLYDQSKKSRNPAYFRILKAKYFEDDLKKTLKENWPHRPY